MASSPPEPKPYPVRWTSRRLPIGARQLVAARLVAKLASKVDVVYSTGILNRSSLGAALGGAPTVIKLTSDPAFERSLRWGLWEHDLGTFQQAGGVRIGALRWARDRSLQRARLVVVPSEALRRLAVEWGVSPQKLRLLHNPVAPPPELPGRDELRMRHAFNGATLVFAGRLVPQKAIHVALDAVRRIPDVSLRVAGEGPYAERLERLNRELGLEERVRFLGPQPRATIFELLHAADAALLSSSWENFPHMVVEALSVGTPVLATDVGGVTEIIRDGWNGLLVPPNEPAELAAAIRRFLDDPMLQQRLRAETRGSVTRFAPDEAYGQLEELLAHAARR
jgi:glycosyltransferase involved in cell wall biosynthesis